MRYFPLELDVQGRDALVLGMAAEVPSKIGRLLDAGARVTLIIEAPLDEAQTSELAALAGKGQLTVAQRPFEERDLEGKAIVFLAPSRAEAEEEEAARARKIHQAALQDGRLFCAIDRPETSTFINVAVVRAPGLVMTVSTEGRSPGTARRIREDLEALFSDPRWARYIAAVGAMRDELARGERASRMTEAVKGFALEAQLRFPGWFERGEARPPRG